MDYTLVTTLLLPLQFPLPHPRTHYIPRFVLPPFPTRYSTHTPRFTVPHTLVPHFTRFAAGWFRAGLPHSQELHFGCPPRSRFVYTHVTGWVCHVYLRLHFTHVGLRSLHTCTHTTTHTVARLRLPVTFGLGLTCLPFPQFTFTIYHVTIRYCTFRLVTLKKGLPFTPHPSSRLRVYVWRFICTPHSSVTVPSGYTPLVTFVLVGLFTLLTLPTLPHTLPSLVQFKHPSCYNLRLLVTLYAPHFWVPHTRLPQFSLVGLV